MVRRALYNSCSLVDDVDLCWTHDFMMTAIALLCDDCGVEDVRDAMEEARLSGGAFPKSWTLPHSWLPGFKMAAEHRAAWSCSPTYRKGDWRRQPPAALPRNYLFSAAAWAPGMNIQCAFHTVTILETRCTQDAGADETKRGEGRREPIHQQTRVPRASQNICLL